MEVIYPFTFAEGEALDPTQLDANFTALAGVVNGHLKRENFRARAGLRNAQKSNPRALVPLVYTAPITLSPPGEITLPGVITLPHFDQYHGEPGLDGGLSDNVMAKPVQLVSLMGMYNRSDGIEAGDTCEVTLRWRPALGYDAGMASMTMGLLDHFFYMDPTDLAEYIQVDLHCATGPVPGTTRNWNVLLILWILAHHLP